MLTIGQLAAYGGVTVRTVRHYHQIGLLPEPERDNLDRRTYDASAVVRLVRVRTLAEAGVPLARVQELLEASPPSSSTSWNACCAGRSRPVKWAPPTSTRPWWTCWTPTRSRSRRSPPG